MKLLSIIFASIFFFIFPQIAVAVENPLSVPNNKFGIHILFPQELEQAAKLVNANGGEWGYVTIPIQAKDKDLIKWQKFMDDARKNRVIPIIRLATEGEFFNTKVWRKPDTLDILDFANFLNSLNWPVKNRYIVVFNEVNRGDEWGGTPKSKEYADILKYATTTFKEKNQDFFIISAGLDNAAQTLSGVSINQYDFLREMYTANQTVFDNVDGLGSHSYPNPGFRQPPTNQGSTSIASFRYEKELVKSLTGKDLPVFITETGWTRDALSEEQISKYYQEAFSSAWIDPAVIAITPFLLRAGTGPFRGFSFIQDNGQNEVYSMFEKLPKTKGQPEVLPIIPVLQSSPSAQVLGTRNFAGKNYVSTNVFVLPRAVKIIGKWLLKIE